MSAVVGQAPALHGDREAVDLPAVLEGDGRVLDPGLAREVQNEVRPLLVGLEAVEGEDVGHVARGEIGLELGAEVDAGAAAHGLDGDGNVVRLGPHGGVCLQGRVDLGLVLSQGDALGESRGADQECREYQHQFLHGILRSRIVMGTVPLTEGERKTKSACRGDRCLFMS